MRPAALAVLCSVLLTLPACADDAGDEGVTVVAAAYPLAYVAERIAGDVVEVEDLVQPGQEPHDAELSPQRTAAVADADLVLRVAGLAPAVDDAVAQESEPGADVEALGVLEHATPSPGGRPVQVLEGDPHFWLDPRALATYADAVVERLVALDPAHADDYARGAEALRRDLDALDDRMSTALADCDRRTVVVSHEAYNYLGYRYDLDFSGVVELSPDAEPGPGTLAGLHTLVEADGVTTVFYEPLQGPAPVETLAADLDLDVAVLDPIEGLTEETADEDYLSLMAADLDALVSANGCGREARS